jgi:hypothetical protein
MRDGWLEDMYQTFRDKISDDSNDREHQGSLLEDKVKSFFDFSFRITHLLILQQVMRDDERRTVVSDH